MSGDEICKIKLHTKWEDRNYKVSSHSAGELFSNSKPQRSNPGHLPVRNSHSTRSMISKARREDKTHEPRNPRPAHAVHRTTALP